MKHAIFAATAVVFIFGATFLSAGALDHINYQGYLTDAQGDAVADGSYSMTFKIYDAPASFAAIWTSGELSVEVEGGLFNIQLGPIPIGIFGTGSNLYLGITVGSDSEMIPRTQLIMAPFAAHAFFSDHAYGIEDYTIKDIDISWDAEIDPAKIEDTAAVTAYGSSNNFQNTNNFWNISYFMNNIWLSDWGNPNALVDFYDSTMMVNTTGIRIGDTEDPVEYSPIVIERNYNVNSPSSRYGALTSVINAGTGTLFGMWSRAERTSSTSTPKYTYGVYGVGDNDHEVGTAVGVFGYASGGYYAYGVCGDVIGEHPDEMAGMFFGDVGIGGDIYYFIAGSRIDHPLDPENKYLSHSIVESPDMKNIYDGNAITDENGRAVVALPAYFEALNADYRYQLTVIGSFARAIIEEEIKNNHFVIATDEPNVKVSWQVTGIRNDPYAQDNRLKVEQEKRDRERGLYLYPQGYGLAETESIYYEAREQAHMDALCNGGE